MPWFNKKVDVIIGFQEVQSKLWIACISKIQFVCASKIFQNLLPCDPEMMSQRKWSENPPDTPIRCYSAGGLWKSSEDPPWAFTAAVQGVVYQTCKVYPARYK